jgi:hypothetical protein
LFDVLPGTQARKSLRQLAQCEQVCRNSTAINGAFEPACTIDATHLAADTLDFLLDWMIDVPIAVHRGAENFRKRKHAGMLTRAVVVDRGWSLSRADELIARSNIYDCRGAAVQLFLSCLDLLQNGSNCRSVAGLTPMRSANHCKFCISELESLVGATHYAGKRLKWLQGGPWKDWAFVISDSKQHMSVCIGNDGMS